MHEHDNAVISALYLTSYYGYLQAQALTMGFTHIKFEKSTGSAFSKAVNERVNRYFKDNNINKHANGNMVFKTVIMLSVFFLPLIIMSTGIIEQTWLVFLLYITSGFGMAGVGMGVMHDAIHGAYSNSKSVNKWLGHSLNLIGANKTVWKIQHNVLHHTYTNVHGADDDVHTPPFLRFTPNTKKHNVHKYQHLYIWFFYAISSLTWVTIKDFVKMTRYKNMGFIKKKNEFRNEMLKLIGWKLFYYTVVLVGPIIFLPMSPLIIVLAFLCMHFVTGLSISLVFQIAHIMPEMQFPIPENEHVIKDDWASHQLATTSNFSPKSKFFSWMIGGLNFQVEHHLFPNICHIHYREISNIVKEVAQEYGIPYFTHNTFASAIRQHYKMLKQLGKMEMATL